MTPPSPTTKVQPTVQQAARPKAGPVHGGSRASDVRAAAIRHAYGDIEVLHDVDLHVEHGEFVTLLGPSGSGKSTLLRIVGGLERPGSGTVRIGDRDVTELPPERREVGVVFQNYALFPHMTVAENVAFPLGIRKMGKQEKGARVREMLELVELSGMEARKPGELSGGQQQRVALARALAFEPRVLLLDEPFGALDRRLREQLGLAVRRVQRELGITTIFVTHDQDEAFTMSTRIAVMNAGRILQIDRPGDVYREPSSLQVARLLGQLNELPVEVVAADAGSARLRGANGLELTVDHQGGLAVGRRLCCGVRPEHITIRSEADGTCTAAAQVVASIFGGTWTRAQLESADREVMATVPADGPALSDGDAVFFGFERGRALLFDDQTGDRVA